MTVRLSALFTLFFVTLLSPLAWAGAPPECTTDEECLGFGYDTCDQASAVCKDADDNANGCESDADCPEGQVCLQLSSPYTCEPGGPAADNEALCGQVACGPCELCEDEVCQQPWDYDECLCVESGRYWHCGTSPDDPAATACNWECLAAAPGRSGANVGVQPEGDDGGCQGGQGANGLLALLAGLGFLVSRRRAALR
ncbi:MAG: hypothetical protein QF464_04130 [Myxococcota bacterium]|nr:hypothetical protein [Myxococcota bacterium]